MKKIFLLLASVISLFILFNFRSSDKLGENIPAYYGTQLDVWYDLEPVTMHSATYSTIGSFQGDFHLVVNKNKLILTPGYPGAKWENIIEKRLVFHYRIKESDKLNSITFDTKGGTHEIEIEQKLDSKQWVELSIDLSKSAINSPVVSITLNFEGSNLNVEIDNVYLLALDGSKLAITDKSLGQRLSEARKSRKSRIDYAFRNSDAVDEEKKISDPNLKRRLEFFFVRLWNADTKKQIAEINNELEGILSSNDPEVQDRWGLRELWNLAVTHFLIRTYNTFSTSAEGDKKDRLSKKTEDALLKILWSRTLHENDIYNSKGSTMRMDASENHDLDSKVASLLSSKIFMNHPDWKDKNYPDEGKTGTYGFWFHRWIDAGINGPEGLADWRGDDTKKYNAKDHYEAWVAYFKKYAKDRAKFGFFLEKASGHYMTYTIGYLLDLYNWCGDDALKKKTRKFLDIVWAEWAVDQIHGLRAGSKTRYRYTIKNTPEGVRDAFSQYSEFLFGGVGYASGSLYSGMLNDYEIPENIWLIAFDRKNLGSYAYVSRNLGESIEDYEGKPGMERTIICDSISRLLRYSWVTPDYILGTQMDHPGVTHNHLSVQGRMQGMYFAEPRGALVWVKGISFDEAEKENIVPYNNTMVRAAQHENVALFQGARRVLRQSPAWFPNESHHPGDMFVGFTKITDISEENGWVFAQSGEALLAVRVVDGVQKDAGDLARANRNMYDYPVEGITVDLVEKGYTWDERKDRIKLDDKWSVVIFEAGSISEYGSMNAFKEYIFGNTITLNKTVVQGFYLITYKFGKEKKNEIYFNAANMQIPKINGVPINYSPEKLFDSPYLNSKYHSGVIEFGLPDAKMVREF